MEFNDLEHIANDFWEYFSNEMILICYNGDDKSLKILEKARLHA